MEELTAAEAAKYLDISREAVDAAAREGRLSVVAGDGPRRFSREAVEEFHQGRQAEKIAKLARAGETPVSVARKVRRGLFHSEVGVPRPFATRLSAMPDAWRSLFSRAELAAACVPDGEGCRWCKSLEFAGVLGLRPPEYAEARVALFGGEPCGTCGPGLVRPYMAALGARVREGGMGRPSGPRPRPSATEMEAAREWAQQRSVTAAVRAARDDGGRALVARRLREVRARAKVAKRSGDRAYALRLAQMARDLEKDAALVDGAAVTASARPGTLRCGHALAAGCSCPRRASTRGRR